MMKEIFIFHNKTDQLIPVGKWREIFHAEPFCAVIFVSRFFGKMSVSTSLILRSRVDQINIVHNCITFLQVQVYVHLNSRTTQGMSFHPAQLSNYLTDDC